MVCGTPFFKEIPLEDLASKRSHGGCQEPEGQATFVGGVDLLAGRRDPTSEEARSALIGASAYPTVRLAKE